VDGLIVMPAGRDHRELLNERRLGLPMVFVDRAASAPDVDSVTSDNRGGAQAAVRHLFGHGHRRIAFLGDLRTIWTAEQRYLGYLEGLATHGLRLDHSLVRRDLRSTPAAEAAAGSLLDRAEPPSAFFAGQNLLTIGVVRALRQRGLQRRVALIGFDDFTLADLLDPPVSVVAQDPQALGRAAAERLFARLDGDERGGEHVQIPTRLVPRGSGESSPSPTPTPAPNPPPAA
jgi:LacI family transcriptional regulator